MNELISIVKSYKRNQHHQAARAGHPKNNCSEYATLCQNICSHYS